MNQNGILTSHCYLKPFIDPDDRFYQNKKQTGGINYNDVEISYLFIIYLYRSGGSNIMTYRSKKLLRAIS